MLQRTQIPGHHVCRKLLAQHKKLFFTNVIRRCMFLALLLIIPDLAWAEVRYEFEWASISTRCNDGPGTAQLEQVQGTYRIPNDQLNRPCELVIVWRLRAASRNSINVSREAVVERRGRLVTRDGQILGPAGSGGDNNSASAGVPVRNLSLEQGGQVRIDLGFELARANGDRWLSTPQFLRFSRGVPTIPTAPRITRVTIRGGYEQIASSVIPLDIRTTGGQVTRYITSENDRFTHAKWRPISGGMQFSHSMRNRQPGIKKIWVKVASGKLVSNTRVLKFRLAGTFRPNSKEAFNFAISQGYQHRIVTRNKDSDDIIKELVFIKDRPSIQQKGDGCFLVSRPSSIEIVVDAGMACDISLFEGRDLNRGWSISVFPTVRGGSPNRGKLTNDTRAGGRRANEKFRVSVAALPPAFLAPRLYFTAPIATFSVKLTGPSADWRDAFRE